jgi:hypothetical protein
MMMLLLIKENHFRRVSSRVIFILSVFLSRVKFVVLLPRAAL